jgi:hypothetical protein
MHSAKIYFTEPNLAKQDVPKLEIGGTDISRGSNDLGETVVAEPMDWRTPLIRYLENPGHFIDMKVQR